MHTLDFDAAPPRRLRVFAFDPSIGGRFTDRKIREVVISLPWELDPSDPAEPLRGPIGEYLEIIDYDPASGAFYDPIDLNDTRVIRTAGLAPAVDDPRFHQQMVYAVAMYTIANFEEALGRVALWAPDKDPAQGRHQEEFVQRLRVYPHALRDANAYYSPEKKALLFGYFESDTGGTESLVFTCLSQDIITHETCHALLDGMHPRFSEASNPDVLALHEAFSDIVAIFQHFTFPEVLRHQISKSRGDLKQRNLLGELAQQFGQALGRGGALRDALGRWKDGQWVLREPDPAALRNARGPHSRGSVLVAAVFRAFIAIYEERTADLIRIASQGTGILRDGALQPDLVERLAQEAAKAAGHILQICIRALDYCPPVDVRMGDYLRAIITADHDLYPDDDRGYRAALIEAFSAWGVLPPELRIVTEQTLLWPTLRDAARDEAGEVEIFEDSLGLLISKPEEMLEEIKSRPDLMPTAREEVLKSLDRDAQRIVEIMNRKMDDRVQKTRLFARTPGRFAQETVLSRNLLELDLEADREIHFHASRLYGRLFWGLITSPNADQGREAFSKLLRITQSRDAPRTVRWSDLTSEPAVEVHSVRMAKRRGKRGQTEREYVVEIIQTRRGFHDEKKQRDMDAKFEPLPADEDGDFEFRCGATLLIDARTFRIRRLIRTRTDVTDDEALARVRRYLGRRGDMPSNAFDGLEIARLKDPKAFALLHQRFRET